MCRISNSLWNSIKTVHWVTIHSRSWNLIYVSTQSVFKSSRSAKALCWSIFFFKPSFSLEGTNLRIKGQWITKTTYFTGTMQLLWYQCGFWSHIQRLNGKFVWDQMPDKVTVPKDYCDTLRLKQNKYMCYKTLWFYGYNKKRCTT